MSAARALASSANAKNIQTSRRSLSCARERSRAVMRARRERAVESGEVLNVNVVGSVTGRRATRERRGGRASAMMGDGDRGERGERDDGEEDEEVGGRRRRRRASRGLNKDASARDEKKAGKKKTQTMAAESKGEAETEAPSDAEGGSTADFIENVVMDAREESFALKKKRMELIIEEKEWDLESPTSSEDEEMIKLVEYVNAVEAFKELCSSEVPNTVGDLLGQYVTVYHLDCDSPGYDEALAFLGIDPDEDEDEDERDMEAWRRATASFDSGSMDEDDDSDDEDEDDEGEYTIEISYGRGDDFDPIKGLHCAQDVEGNWRWLEDDLGRPLSMKPFGEFTPKLMSVEYMLKVGLNVNSLHEEVDPLELLNFSGCKSWEDTLRASQEATAALRQLEDDGWKVDTRSWCNEQDHLIVVKELVPLRTMSFVDGSVTEDENEDGQEDEDR